MPDPTLKVQRSPSSSELLHGKIRGEKAVSFSTSRAQSHSKHPGDIAVSQYPTGPSLFLPSDTVMFKPVTTALRPGGAEKQKQSRQWADEGKNSMETKWNRKPDSNKTIGGMPSLRVFPSFVSSAVPVVLLCLQGKGGNKISKLTPC